MCEIIYNFQIWTVKLSCVYKKTIMEYKVNLETGTKRVNNFQVSSVNNGAWGCFRVPQVSF